MLSLTNYSTEERNLYNPSYIGAILYQAIREHQIQNNNKGLPCTLAYLIVPLAVLPRYSLNLPKAITTPIASWVVEYEGELIGFSESATACIDIVNSAILFLLAHEAIILSNEGDYSIKNYNLAKIPALIQQNQSFKRSFLSAGFLGRWFAIASSVESIYTHLGVKP